MGCMIFTQMDVSRWLLGANLQSIAFWWPSEKCNFKRRLQEMHWRCNLRTRGAVSSGRLRWPT
jgi:hypothetical protein